jgi:hypothetical protein
MFWLDGCRKVFCFLLRRLRYNSLIYDRVVIPVGDDSACQYHSFLMHGLYVISYVLLGACELEFTLDMLSEVVNTGCTIGLGMIVEIEVVKEYIASYSF